MLKNPAKLFVAVLAMASLSLISCGGGEKPAEQPAADTAAVAAPAPEAAPADTTANDTDTTRERASTRPVVAPH